MDVQGVYSIKNNIETQEVFNDFKIAAEKVQSRIFCILLNTMDNIFSSNKCEDSNSGLVL